MTNPDTSTDTSADAGAEPAPVEKPEDVGQFVVEVLCKLLTCHGEAYHGANDDAAKLQALLKE